MICHPERGLPLSPLTGGKPTISYFVSLCFFVGPRISEQVIASRAGERVRLQQTKTKQLFTTKNYTFYEIESDRSRIH